MQRQISQRFLVVYSGVLTAALAVIVLGGFVNVPRKVSFDQIDVKRINVVEPDGTLRLVISDRSRFPGAFVRGHEYAFDRGAAGLLFYNDEGSENGGLIFGGSKAADGTVSSSGHLSFDQYEQDQMFAIDASQKGDQRAQKVVFADYPQQSIEGLFQRGEQLKDASPAQRQAELDKYIAAHGGNFKRRLVLSRAPDGRVGMDMNDAQGRTRMRIGVAADGTPSLELLDASGKVVNALKPQS